jgi:hypothetical protein
MLMYRTVLGRLKERQGRTWQEQRNTVSDVERVATTSRRLKEAFVEMVGECPMSLAGWLLCVGDRV